MAIIATGVKKKPQELFTSLIPIYEPEFVQKPSISLKKSMLFNRMLAAVGGDKINLG